MAPALCSSIFSLLPQISELSWEFSALKLTNYEQCTHADPALALALSGSEEVPALQWTRFHALPNLRWFQACLSAASDAASKKRKASPSSS